MTRVACLEYDEAKRAVRTADQGWLALVACIRLQTIADARRVLRSKHKRDPRWHAWDSKPDYMLAEGMRGFNITWEHVKKGGI